MQSDQINELAAALAAAQGEMPSAKFNQTNPFLKNKYADLGSVIEASREVLAKNNLAVSQLVIGGEGHIGVETILMHKSGQWLSSVVSLPTGEEKGKSMAQVAGSIVSYLRRYSLASMLAIYADEDTDGNKPDPTSKEKQEKKPQTINPPVAAQNGNQRPYLPETVRSKMTAHAAGIKDFVPSDKQKALLRYCLDLCFPGDPQAETKRHDLLFYLTGHESTNDVSGPQLKTLLDVWLKPVQDNGGEYTIDAMAVKEAQAIITAGLVAEGQQALL